MKTYPDGRSAQTVVSAEVVNDLGAIIDSLRAENARLRAALEVAANHLALRGAAQSAAVVRAALAGTPR